MAGKKKKDAYSEAGVDIDAAREAVGGFKARVAETFTGGVLSQVGNFGGMFSLAGSGMEEPVLVSSADGVGTKLLVAGMAGRHDTVGRDLVNHCVNDIMVQGAKPLFFMDYISTGRMVPERIQEIMTGFIEACKENQTALLGGETAEMPDMYSGEDYDLAGFIVGLVDRKKLITGDRVHEGHLLLGLPSTGLHTNGYSLARRLLFHDLGHEVDDPLPGGDGESVGEALLAVHRSYKRALEALFERGLVDAAAHITGGGLTDNIPRVIPAGLDADIQTGTWPVPRIFSYIVEKSGMSDEESLRVFNMGIGMVLIVDRDKADEAAAALGFAGEEAMVIGRITRGEGRVVYHN